MTEDSKHYALYEATTYKHNSTSDRVIIWDEDNDEMVNFVYGATILGVDELDKIITEYVAEYEAKQKSKAKAKVFVKYNFDKAGIKAWSNDVVDDILEREITCDYAISHGNRIIHLPDLAQIHELLEHFLEDAEEEGNE
jgi:hypothetical protein